MEKINRVGYSLKDVAIVQETVSRFSSRSQVIPFVKTCKKETLPIFVSPMDSVTDENNYKIWQNNKLTPVIPRTVQKRLSLRDRLILGRECFISLSLNETEKLFKLVKEDTVLMYLSEECPLYICIDIAHGTMSKLLDLCKDIKSKYGQRVIIMTGNIANPEAYKLYCKAHIDYVRCGIGGGSRCFPKGTKILLQGGEYVNIEDIKVGDKVYTHTGKKKEVILTYNRNYLGDFIKINDNIVSTSNHKYFVINKKDKDKINSDNIINYGYWVEAKDLDKNIHLLIKYSLK